MLITRTSKTILVAAIGLYASLVALGNITDYGSNFAFVQHVLSMDSVFPDATTTYRALTEPMLHHAAYILIIAAELTTAVLCWMGAVQMFRARAAEAVVFNRSKKWAIAGLTCGFLVWQVGFMSLGGEWFGMWMSSTWNGLQSAFRVFITIVAVLIFVTQKDGELSE
jgi:predicted small integral membrane protein